MAIQRNEEIKCGNHIAVTGNFNFTGSVVGLYKITDIKKSSRVGSDYIDFHTDGREYSFTLIKNDDFSDYKDICGESNDNI
jgi:hypothetical protein